MTEEYYDDEDQDGEDRYGYANYNDEVDDYNDGKTSPQEMVEERVLMLEAWMDEAADAGEPEDPDLYEKHQEYLGMYEELEIISKKLRKTDKMLGSQPMGTKKKLERKRLQYLREVEDIVSYVVGDVFFLDGQEEEDFVSQLVVTTNPLLGQPLESIIERPGMEDSQRFTLDSLPGFFAMSQARLGSSLGSLGAHSMGSRGSIHKPSSTGMLGVKKKGRRSSSIKKTNPIDDMLNEAELEDDPVFLSPVGHNGSDASLDLETALSPTKKNSSKKKKRNGSSSDTNHFSTGSGDGTLVTTSTSGTKHADLKTLQKKLKKVESLLSKSGLTTKEQTKYEKKRREYLQAIEEAEYNGNNGSSNNGSGNFAQQQREAEEAERKRREREERAERERERRRQEEEERRRREEAEEEERRRRRKKLEEEAQRRREVEEEEIRRLEQEEEARRRKSLDRQKQVENEIRALGKEMLEAEEVGSRKNHSKSSSQASSSPKQPPGTKEEYEMLKKKYQKAQKLMAKAITLKEVKKFEKKCKEYQDKLEAFEDWNWEVSELEKLNKQDEERHHAIQERKRQQQEEEEEEARLEEERRKENERWLEESQRLEFQERLEASQRGEMIEEEAEARILEEEGKLEQEILEQEQQERRIVEKKLKKVEGLMHAIIEKKGEAGFDTKEYKKYEKKQRQYLDELGIDYEDDDDDINAEEDKLRRQHEEERLRRQLAEAQEEQRRLEEEEQRRIEEEEEERRRQAAERQRKKAANNNNSRLSPEQKHEKALLQKKLKKVEKMMAEALRKNGSNSKEYAKLQKKKNQYISELGAL